jgi:hypothetical protein
MRFAPAMGSLPGGLAIVAGLAFAATISGVIPSASTATPITRTVRTAHRSKPQIYLAGQHHDTSCQSQYYECVWIADGSPATQEWCVIYSGASDCTDLYPGTWTWTSTVTSVKGKPTKKVRATFSPDPGNPTTLTISTSSKKGSAGQVAYVVSFTACNSASSCVGPVQIGVVTRGAVCFSEDPNKRKAGAINVNPAGGAWGTCNRNVVISYPPSTQTKAWSVDITSLPAAPGWAPLPGGDTVLLLFFEFKFYTAPSGPGTLPFNATSAATFFNGNWVAPCPSGAVYHITLYKSTPAPGGSTVAGPFVLTPTNAGTTLTYAGSVFNGKTILEAGPKYGIVVSC